MPFIQSKVSVGMTREQKESLKTKLGQAITIFPGKSERWLMVGLEDNCDLYFQGSNAEPAAFIEVKVFGGFTDAASEKMTAELCRIYGEELGISASRIYIKYEEVERWGRNGSNL